MERGRNTNLGLGDLGRAMPTSERAALSAHDAALVASLGKASHLHASEEPASVFAYQRESIDHTLPRIPPSHRPALT